MSDPMTPPRRIPEASSPAVSKSMLSNKGKDTKPKLSVRRVLRGKGFPGYRLNWKKAPGRPAIADRLFLEKQSRAEALICIFNMGVLLRGLIQLLLRRGLERIPDGALPRYGVDRGPLQRNVTHAYFILKSSAFVGI